MYWPGSGVVSWTTWQGTGCALMCDVPLRKWRWQASIYWWVESSQTDLTTWSSFVGVAWQCINPTVQVITIFVYKKSGIEWGRTLSEKIRYIIKATKDLVNANHISIQTNKQESTYDGLAWSSQLIYSPLCQQGNRSQGHGQILNLKLPLSETGWCSVNHA